MNLLVLCHEYPPIGGGAAAVCAALSAEYVRGGHKVVVLTMAMDGLPERERAEGLEIWRLKCGRKRKEMASVSEAIKWAQQASRVAQELHAETPFDATHAHFLMPAGIVADRLNRRSGVPWLVTPHGTDVPGYNRARMRLAHVVVRPWWRSLCHRAGKIICPSASLLQLLSNSASEFRGTVIPNGFKAGRFEPLEKHRRILLCSRLVERKGFQYLLQALVDVDLPGWQVDIVGDGPMFNRLKKLAAQCRVPVTMHGWLDNDSRQLRELYGHAMIFVFPSEWENFSIALLEGMSAGCAVVATDVAGNPEALGDTGRLVPPKDVAALRTAVLELTSDTEGCRNLGKRACQRAVSLFDWSILSQQYLAELNELIDARREPERLEQAGANHGSGR